VVDRADLVEYRVQLVLVAAVGDHHSHVGARRPLARGRREPLRVPSDQDHSRADLVQEDPRGQPDSLATADHQHRAPGERAGQRRAHRQGSRDRQGHSSLHLFAEQER